MSERKIRPIAICVIRRNDDELLLLEGYDKGDGLTFYRPLGGGIEFGEKSHDAVVREIREELGAEIVEPRLLGVLENVFEFESLPRHEIVFVFEAALADPSLATRDALEAREADGSTIKTVWKRLRDFPDPKAPLVPDGLFELLQRP